ncbi:galactan 5-O-arabinofuranosyltransferase [Corynebacterium caspium]|uniref:galactan 5-O-arabinofuranosyltransferase n=1 Tax=Corynebacterium caspium TaxID=234828 RepID=UPI000360A228|nr:galactan 5-O-arabinofuranosyltransferase [Corynebacterium caspium]WKD58509.1 Arabinofuranosyltransferase AftA [Corynebacterium caspium DSM 44850]
MIARPDTVSTRATLVGMVAAPCGGGLLALLAWFVLKQTSMPAFNTSMVTRALANAGTIMVLLAVVAISWNWLRKRNLKTLTYVVSYLAPAGLVIASLGIPLSATRLYLEGLQVDQGFRTQFLTRMTQTAHLADMNYPDIPTYYPAGWFWLGGRLANILGLPGWEAFQPWALVSISAAACLLVPVWQRLCGSLPLANGIALTTTAIILVTCAVEPYAAVVALGAPAAVMMSQRALQGAWPSTLAIALYLGISATHYTLYTGVVALTMVTLALFATVRQRRIRPLIHLLVMGLSSLAIAAITWGPYILAILGGHPHSGATAAHYLPVESTTTPMPFFETTVVGFLSLVGLVSIVVCWKYLRTMALGLACFYGWTVASMLTTLVQKTLLGFRVETLIVAQCATIGLLGLAIAVRGGLAKFYPQQVSARGRQLSTALALVLLGAGGLQYAQEIPARNEIYIDLAFTETDGYGERADRFEPNTGQYYQKIRELIATEPANTVVLTDETNFMSVAPYLGFQAFTSHYANPLGEFDLRNKTIAKWAELSWENPQEFQKALNDIPWRGPEVFIFRGDASDATAAAAVATDSNQKAAGGWKIHIAEDIYPNQPNVRYVGLFFNPAAFANKNWEISQVGPFVVVKAVVEAIS